MPTSGQTGHTKGDLVEGVRVKALAPLVHQHTGVGFKKKSKLTHFLQWEISTFYSGVGRGMRGRRVMTSAGGGAEEDENSILHQREESCREGRGEGGDRWCCLREGRRDERP